MKRRYFYAVTAAILIFGIGEVAQAAPFTLQSKDFKEGAMLPKKAANSMAIRGGNPNCVGENISPQLSWSGAPEGTKSYAITLFDPEANGGTGFIHWVAYGIPASVTGFDEGEASKPSDKYVGGKNGGGATIYFGPCVPLNTSPHQFLFTLFATDLDTKDLPPGLTRDELLAKLASHVKGISTLVGTFVNPWHE